MTRKFLQLSLFSILLCSCEQKVLEPDNILLGLQFYPISVGTEYEFSVEEINYRNTGNVDTSRYFLIDRVLEAQELEGLTEYRGYRYRRALSGEESIVSTLTITVDTYHIMRRLGNTKEIIFSFPVKEAVSWDALPGPEQQDTYTFYKAFQPYELSDTVFSQSVQVIEENNQDSLEFLDTRINVYVADSGPVYSLSSQIEFCTLSECFGLKKIEIGTTRRMKRIFLNE